MQIEHAVQPVVLPDEDGIEPGQPAAHGHRAARREIAREDGDIRDDGRCPSERGLLGEGRGVEKVGPGESRLQAKRSAVEEARVLALVAHLHVNEVDAENGLGLACRVGHHLKLDASGAGESVEGVLADRLWCTIGIRIRLRAGMQRYAQRGRVEPQPAAGLELAPIDRQRGREGAMPGQAQPGDLLQIVVEEIPGIGLCREGQIAGDEA
jgi:hypothetical protein